MKTKPRPAPRRRGIFTPNKSPPSTAPTSPRSTAGNSTASDGRRHDVTCSGTIATTCGISIWDVTPVTRKGATKPRFVGQSAVSGQGNHHATPAVIGGKPYVIGANELAISSDPTDFRANCESAAYPRIWDIGDERAPRVVGEFRMQVQDHCDEDDVQRENQMGNFASHYNAVDDRWGETRLGLFGMTASGLRVVDLRDPAKPREIAYYNPGANAVTTMQPGVHGFSNLFYNPAVTDACASKGHFVKETGHIWFSCQSNGLFIAELTGEARDWMARDR